MNPFDLETGGLIPRHSYYNRDGTPMENPTQVEIMEAFRGPRRVGLTKVTDAADPSCDTEVSTVFLVMNHQYGDGPPILFETMTFWIGDPGMPENMERYATEIEAEIGHRVMVEKIARSMKEPVVVEVELGD